MANQNQGYSDDQQIRQLQQQVQRLKNVVQNYEYQLANLSNSPKNANQRNYLRQLLDQGEKIRQDTLSLLKAKSTSSMHYLIQMDIVVVLREMLTMVRVQAQDMGLIMNMRQVEEKDQKA